MSNCLNWRRRRARTLKPRSGCRYRSFWCLLVACNSGAMRASSAPARRMLRYGTSQPLRTSPVHRGKWVLETILGTQPPPPPPDVDNVLKEATDEKKNLTVRQRLERH